MVQPYLVYQEAAQAEWWIPEAFSEAAAQRVLEGLKKIVNSPEGTGYGAHRDDVVLAGKTGTAEIKDSKGDTEVQAAAGVHHGHHSQHQDGVPAEAVEHVGDLGREVRPGDGSHNEEEDQESRDDESGQAVGIDKLVQPGLLKSF